MTWTFRNQYHGNLWTFVILVLTTCESPRLFFLFIQMGEIFLETSIFLENFVHHQCRNSERQFRFDKNNIVFLALLWYLLTSWFVCCTVNLCGKWKYFCLQAKPLCSTRWSYFDTYVLKPETCCHSIHRYFIHIRAYKGGF